MKKKHLILILFCFISSFSFAQEPIQSPLFCLTWQKDPLTTMTIQWIDKVEQNENDLFYREESEAKWSLIAGKKVSLPDKIDYALHRVELTGLLPGKTYVFRLGGRSSLSKFRTMPEKLDAPFSFAIGGDMFQGSGAPTKETNQQVAKKSPLFVLLGGDFVYGIGGKAMSPQESANRWYTWMEYWDRYMLTPDGYRIPLIPAIGNHETKGFYRQSKEDAAYFYGFFPFPGNRGYNVLDFGNYLSLFVLDSDHTNPVEGAQTQWLLGSMEQRKNISSKFALYHVPAYPSVRAFNGEVGKKIRKNWVPIFERFSLSCAFENHEHAYKRSHLILHDQINPKGVLYLGDGAWGVEKARKPKINEWYLAKALPERHFIYATIENGKHSYQAISSSGAVIDSYVREFHPSDKEHDENETSLSLADKGF